MTRLANGPDGATLRVAGLRLFSAPGREHLAELQLHVAPEHRRRGAGSQLLSAVVAAACRSENRRSLVVEAAADGPGEAFCERWGFRRVLTLNHLLLRLDRTEGSERAGETAPPATG
ncbi:GNAT family N-acetyltransferase [Streptomyces sp. NPDC000410]|uniref:GNAT family N-acetyltransferase n=1 Tax=Streptomyces sp. NPDC000410 TaxID=3154254 RepID=UPI003323F004